MAQQRSRPRLHPEMAPKKHRITFRALTVWIDDDGIRQESWKDIRSAWAAVNHRSGAYRWSSGNYSEEVTDLFLIRSIPGWMPTPAMKLRWGDREFEIESVEDIREEHQDIEIRAVYRETIVGGASG